MCLRFTGDFLTKLLQPHLIGVVIGFALQKYSKINFFEKDVNRTSFSVVLTLILEFCLGQTQFDSRNILAAFLWILGMFLLD